MWPGVTELSGWNQQIPQYPARGIASAVPTLDPIGLQLLDSMLQYDPNKRISAKNAMLHQWFSDVPPEIKELSKVG
ncbi:MAG: hypothetical protein EZS28_050709 [Streblomastix strix]|uniref:Protein kinase domain-containing protein n=1 Tax=Streblomastix strix TaxID=222440 RepID=A0A5J4T5X8_9EUKA|nr:MAG: hypothetical protein EZS28_050709 [Streblomastix strix]